MLCGTGRLTRQLHPIRFMGIIPYDRVFDAYLLTCLPSTEHGAFNVHQSSMHGRLATPYIPHACARLSSSHDSPILSWSRTLLDPIDGAFVRHVNAFVSSCETSRGVARPPPPFVVD